jgi:hypothetical protein
MTTCIWREKKHRDYIQLWPLHKNDPLHVHALKLHMAPEEVNIEEDWAQQGYLLKNTICWLIINNPCIVVLSHYEIGSFFEFVSAWWRNDTCMSIGHMVEEMKNEPWRS